MEYCKDERVRVAVLPSGLGFHSPRPLPRDHAPVEAATQTAMMLCRSSRRCTEQCGIIGSTNTSRICQRIYGDCPYIAAREVYPPSVRTAHSLWTGINLPAQWLRV